MKPISAQFTVWPGWLHSQWIWPWVMETIHMWWLHQWDTTLATCKHCVSSLLQAFWKRKVAAFWRPTPAFQGNRLDTVQTQVICINDIRDVFQWLTSLITCAKIALWRFEKYLIYLCHIMYSANAMLNACTEYPMCPSNMFLASSQEHPYEAELAECCTRRRRSGGGAPLHSDQQKAPDLPKNCKGQLVVFFADWRSWH